MRESLLAAIAAVAVSFSASVWAGVRGESVTHLRQSGQDHEIHGKITAQGERYRIDQQVVGVSQSTIVDYFSRRAIVLIHSRKVYVETTLNDAVWRQMLMRGSLPQFPPNRREKGEKPDYTFKTLKDETVLGHLCRVFEVSWKDAGGRTVLTKIWAASDLEGFPLKAMTSAGADFLQTTEVNHLQIEKIPEAEFQAPGDYARAQDGMIGFTAPRD